MNAPKEGHTEGRINRLIKMYVNRQTERHTVEAQTDKQLHRQLGELIYVDTQTEGYREGRTDKQSIVQIDRQLGELI